LRYKQSEQRKLSGDWKDFETLKMFLSRCFLFILLVNFVYSVRVYNQFDPIPRNGRRMKTASIIGGKHSIYSDEKSVDFVLGLKQDALEKYVNL
jgi:hypothetical protein